MHFEYRPELILYTRKLQENRETIKRLEEEKAAEEKRLEKERKAAEEKRREEEKRAAEAKRLEEERRAAEEKRLEEERKAAEEKRLEEERKAAEKIAESELWEKVEDEITDFESYEIESADEDVLEEIDGYEIFDGRYYEKIIDEELPEL